MQKTILEIALAGPFRQCFDYILPETIPLEQCKPGCRVSVSFGRRQMIGMVNAIKSTSDYPIAKLKPIVALVDKAPILDAHLLQLCRWTSDYYHHPLGDVLFSSLPQLLRQGKEADYQQERYWRVTQQVPSLNDLKRAPQQLKAFDILKQHADGLSNEQIKRLEISAQTLSALQKKGFLEDFHQAKQSMAPTSEPQSHLTLNSEQTQALEMIVSKFDQFQPILLDGITGSGKTEVYLQAIDRLVSQDKQCLVLVPEINLTPQTVKRFQNRFTVPIAVIHSNLTEYERLNAWLDAKSGKAKIVIGTRSAIYTPLKNLGIIIVDEEHDLSFKQQSGLRYSARDLACVRGHLQQIPVVLGSATPSLESLANVQAKRYAHCRLTIRAGGAQVPSFNIIDLRKEKIQQGMSSKLIELIGQHLQQGNQVLLFLNRRGYAPTLFCHQCGWIARCQRCDANLTLHHQPAFLQCHHCGATRSIDQQCQACHHGELIKLGIGTERLEQHLQALFPEFPITRMDRDTTRRKGQMQSLLQQINAGTPQILIGTQMLAKGHHFPDVTLVGILDADSGFMSSDFRACERIGQLILQVAGRAGRAHKAGEVCIQTHVPNHPLLPHLIEQDYARFATEILNERREAQLPPYAHLALLRAKDTSQQKAFDLLEAIKVLANKNKTENLFILGPIVAPMEKKAGKYRVQLLLQSPKRSLLQQLLKRVMPEIDNLPLAKQVQWSLDVDPVNLM